MKPLASTLLLLALSFAAAFAAADEASKKKYPAEFQKAIREAISAFQKRDFSLAEKEAVAAAKILPEDKDLLNLRGAIAVEREQYDEATRLFEKALEMDPKDYSVRFNLSEIPFRQKKYTESRKKLEALLEDHSKDELVLYKIYLSYLFEKDVAHAKEILDSIKFPSDTPAYYYGQAAWALAHGNTKEAEEWINASLFVFKPDQNELFAASLREVGWLKPVEAPSPAESGAASPVE